MDIRNNRHPLFVAVSFICLFSISAGVNAAGEWPVSLASAKAGDTITLGAGVFRAGVKLPPGVSLRGAGVDKTILEAASSDVGLSIEGGQGATLSDLTIRDSRQIGLFVRNASRTTISRIRTTGTMTGLVFSGVVGGRIENCLSDSNRYGFVIGGGEDNVIVNCTAADDSSLGISIPTGKHTVAFNNCVAHSATGVYVGIGASDLHLDHNVYAAMYVGKMEGQVGRKMIGEWAALVGQDAHSVEQPVTFHDATAGDFRAANPLTWALDRAATAEWGVAEFAGVKAPSHDIGQTPYAPKPDAGCYATHIDPPRPADGTFLVKSSDGITSAGIFSSANREVAYLFHNLPLKAGEHHFWFPARDFEGKLISSGSYEVRTAESQLNWQYLGMVGNNGSETGVGATAAVGTARIAFDNNGQLLTACNGWAENFVNMRAYDEKSGAWHWAFHGPADVRGLCAGPDDACYAFRVTGAQQRLTRIDARTGKVLPWPKLGTGELVLHIPADAGGLAEMDGRLFLNDERGGKLWSSPVDNPNFSAIADVPGIASLSADASHHTLWAVANGGHVVAMSADGKIVADSAPVEMACAVAACNGRLAVASAATGKVHLFDCSDPSHLKPLSTIGTGDGPYGAFAPDRFTFQHADHLQPYLPTLALGLRGEVAVTDRNRVGVFDETGKNLWYSFGIFGVGAVPNYSDRSRFFEFENNWSYRLDLKKGTWSVEAFWEHPVFSGHSFYMGDFSLNGHAFGVYQISDPKNGPNDGLLFVRLENFKQIPVLAIQYDPNAKAYVTRKDSNHDEKIDPAGRAEPFCTANAIFNAYSRIEPNGDILSIGMFGLGDGVKVLHCSGLNADGLPLYKAEDRRVVTQSKDTPLISPYNYKPESNVPTSGVSPAADGGFNILAYLGSNPGGAGLFNGVGTDPIGIDASGRVRWVLPLARHQGVYNIWTVGDISFTCVGTTAAIVPFDKDGLGLGSFNQPPSAHYNGYWLDHKEALYAFKGSDDNTYVIICDNYNGTDRWWRLDSRSKLVHASFPATLSATSAQAIAALPVPDGKTTGGRAATAAVRIARLSKALPIDGDLKKWRTAGISPNIIITPETAVAGINGPADASAVIRLAYHGKDLYAQILRFDDVVTFHQPVERHYMQDCIEMCINGFGKGFKFDITRTTDKGDIIIRQRFFDTKLEMLLPPERAPRVIKVLDNAKDVPERELIESVYGEDLSKCRVIVTEFKLPIDEHTYAGAKNALFPVAPGKTFWLGFMIDDNDEPGTDVQRLMVWPATYGTFSPAEDSALATFGD